MLFDAETLARGWLSVALASGDDVGRPALHRTISIEAYPEGVRLVATDSYMLLRTFVPSIDGDSLGEPLLDEVPFSTAVAMDPHRRGLQFLAHLLKLVTGKGSIPLEVRLDLGVIEPADDAQQTFEGLDAQWVVLELPDVERHKLFSYEGEYPTWRKVMADFVGYQTDAIALNPEILGRLAKLGTLHPTSAIAWRWGGPRKMALVDVIDAEPYVTGAVMPVRWDFDRNAPREDAGPPPEGGHPPPEDDDE